MQRLGLSPRGGYQDKVAATGMHYHTIDGKPYWDESACYRFNSSQIDVLDDASAELHKLCLLAVAEIIRNDMFAQLQIPANCIPQIIQSWEANAASVYGRFDLAWNGCGPPKLLEYNADTPTALLEASVVQWFWLQERFPDADQFNSIHEKLIAFWQNFPYRHLPVHFSCSSDSSEDLGNIEYLRDTAIQAGCQTSHLFIEEIGWEAARHRFVDLHEQTIHTLFKLYPWEWLMQDEFSRHVPDSRMHIIEPAWKMLLSNKGILPILWELFPGHPNLLPAFFSDFALSDNYVRKPLYSREGSNIELRHGAKLIQNGGRYGKEGFIYQSYTELPVFDGNYPVIGSWIIGNSPAGIGIREDSNPITSNLSRFIPHYIEEY